MGYYLNINIIPKNKDENVNTKPLTILYYRSSNEMFSLFNENNILPSVNWDEENSRELTVEDIDKIINSQKESIGHTKDQLLRYYKILSYCGANTDERQKENLGVDSMTVSETESYLRELEDMLIELEVIKRIVEESKRNLSDIDHVEISIT